MAYKSIYSYPPEEREKIRTKWREYQTRYRPRRKAILEEYAEHFCKLAQAREKREMQEARCDED